MTYVPENTIPANLAVARAHFAALTDLGLADVQQNAARGDVFLDITVEGFRFQASVGKLGPYIALKTRGGGSCRVGVVSINQCASAGCLQEPSWHVAKYHNQPRIDIAGLSDAGRRALAVWFGIPHHMPGLGLSCYLPEYFYVSPAFAALSEWTAIHSRKIRTFAANDHLGDWAGAADAASRLTSNRQIGST